MGCAIQILALHGSGGHQAQFLAHTIQADHMDCSQETAAKVDSAVQKLLNEAYANAKRVLMENRPLLDEISEYLLLKETITGEELMAFIKAAKEPQETENSEA